MPKLGKYDELAHQFASKQDVENARAAIESIVPTSRGPLQFDMVSRQRLQDVLRTLSPEALSHEQAYQVPWRMADNQITAFTYVELRDLITEAESLAGPRAISAFQKAQEFKAVLAAGGELTMRDISPENW